MTDSQTRELLPEVQTYITAKAEAERTQREAHEALEAKYRTAYSYEGGVDYYSDEKRELRRAHSREQEATYTATQIATNEAWNSLTQSSDPLVRFIGENCKEYQGYAVDVLRLLPATVDELDELAENQDWCHIWGQFRDQAIEAGVMPGYAPLSTAHKAVLDGIDDVSCCRMDTSARRRIGALLDALVTEAKTESAQAAA